MKFQYRKSSDRGHAQHGWLDSWHSFSFGEYYDPQHMGFRSLRVINQDRVAPISGFPAHPHRDMEIFSYVLSGQLEHKDSMGNGRRLSPGQVQLMSAGSGVTHSEYNPLPNETSHFLQIWIQPDQRGLVPSYTEWQPSADVADQSKVLMISPDGRDGSAVIHQDAYVWRMRIRKDQSETHAVAADRGVWIQIIEGKLRVGDLVLEAGDAVSTEDPGVISLHADADTELLWFDLK
jgi:redox-sensitive bicupin YhaK (pirin superfamily)